MKLLIVTQVVDRTDPHLGFFHTWIEQFARECELVTVICLKEGEHVLPQNVRVFSLGKEKGRASSIVYAWRFLKIIVRQRNTYDSVFVHMNPEYIILGGLFFKLWHKKVALWYAHKSVTLKLKIAVFFSDYIFSVTKNSFGIKTPKLYAMGHGVDTELFVQKVRTKSDTLRLVSVGRIAGSKHLKEMLPVVEELQRRGENPVLTIVGAAVTPAEQIYKTELVSAIEKMGLSDAVIMYGGAAHRTLPQLFLSQDVFLNFGTTGNMDKAGFEPLASGLPLVTTNEAFEEILSPYGLYVKGNNPASLADAVLRAKDMEMAPFVEYVRINHSLSNLVPNIIARLS